MMAPWRVETLNRVVDAELAALPADMRARFVRIAELIVSAGLERVGMPYVRSVRRPLWEIRFSGRAGIGRALYITAQPRRVVVLRVFVKKAQRTPQKEIDLAFARLRQLSGITHD